MKKPDKLSFAKAACLPVAGLSTSLLLAVASRVIIFPFEAGRCSERGR